MKPKEWIAVTDHLLELSKNLTEATEREAVPMVIIPAAEKEEIDFNWLRNLLFSIRDNSTYCPLCRCPEWSSQYPDMRTSHYEGCNLGLACEQLLRLYPKENAVVKWRK